MAWDKFPPEMFLERCSQLTTTLCRYLTAIALGGPDQTEKARARMAAAVAAEWHFALPFFPCGSIEVVKGL